MNEHNTHNSLSIGAVVLIFIGIVFLLNNFGIIPWNMWNILWRLWPLIFIFMGLEAILGKTQGGRAILFAVAIVVLGFILWVLFNPRASGLINYNNMKDFPLGRQTPVPFRMNY